MQLKYFNFNKITILIVVTYLLISCDDGNIVVNSFDFDSDTNLSLCQQEDITVLYFIDQETNESISFRFSNEEFDGTFIGLEDSDTLTLNINDANEVVYRKLSASVNGSDYFCQQVPPSSPQVLEEFKSTTGGTATLLINISEQDDNDGVPRELEEVLDEDGNLLDTDQDGIPDYLDTDDDNDNVLTTSEELEALDENGNVITDENGVVYVDTDGDGTPNYLDDNDDGDAVLTINEDLNACDDPENPALNPDNDLNADGLPNYLNNAIEDSFTINVVKNNSISRTFFTQVVFNDITFENQNNAESLTFTSFIMGRYTTSATQNLPFNDTVVSEEEAGNFCQ